jgi:DNA integrity scanning protein DisA with diadenylate cyclase activity
MGLSILTGFIEIGPLDIVDIFLSALLLYFLYNLMRGTAAINIFIGIVAIYLIWKLVNALHMELLSEILGAIIVVAKHNELRQFSETGVLIDAKLSDFLLENIFFKNNPLHDGAVIILRNKIHAARCVLPLTKNTNFPEDYGLRHRAAVGLTEISDAVAIVVSEQTGEIAFSKETRLFIHVTVSQLKNFLEQEFN